MFHRSTILFCVFSLGVAAEPQAQRNTQTQPEQALSARLLDRLLIPIHTAPDDPVGGPYGIWAAGPGYKVSFHDGFRFYPVLGPQAPKNLPFCWHTESVTIAGRPLFASGVRPAKRRAGPLRFEYLYPGVVEAYDVRRDGVEQTFTILERPPTTGDIVVTGRVEGGLVLPRTVEGDAPIELADAAGVARVRYGRAVAIDATGNETGVVRKLVNGRIRLVLTGDWLKHAGFPVTIDPLTSPLLVGSTGANQVLDLDFDSNQNGIPTLALVFTRTSSKEDLDTYGVLLDTTLGPLTGFWSDLNEEWSSERPKIAVWSVPFVAWQRNHTVGRETVSTVHLYHHATPDKGHSSGHWLSIPARKGFTQRQPDVNSSTNIGTTIRSALVTWQEDFTATGANTATTSVHAVHYDLATASLDRPMLVAGGDSLDVENADQSRNQSRFVVYQQRPSVGFGRWQVYARFYDASTKTFEPALHLSAAHAGLDCITPRVDGAWHRQACTYVARSSTAKMLATTRIERPIGSSITTVTSGHVLTTVGAFHPLTLDDMSIGGNSLLWNVLYRHGVGSSARIDITRIGTTGAPVETATALASAGRAACVGEHRSLGSPVFYVEAAAPNSIFARWFRHSPEAAAIEVGRPCPGRLSQLSVHPPYAGSGPYLLAANYIPVGTPCILWVAMGSGQQQLPGGTCTLHLDPATSMTALGFNFAQVGPFGHPLSVVDLLDAPLFIGDLHYQVTWVDGNTMRATNALQLRVR